MLISNEKQDEYKSRLANQSITSSLETKNSSSFTKEMQAFEKKAEIKSHGIER